MPNSQNAECNDQYTNRKIGAKFRRRYKSKYKSSSRFEKKRQRFQNKHNRSNKRNHKAKVKTYKEDQLLQNFENPSSNVYPMNLQNDGFSNQSYAFQQPMTTRSIYNQPIFEQKSDRAQVSTLFSMIFTNFRTCLNVVTRYRIL